MSGDIKITVQDSLQDEVKRLKISILRQQIKLGFAYTSYSLSDKVYKNFHICAAAIVSILIIVAQSIDANRISGFFSILLSAIVTFLIKLRDYLRYDQIKDLSKQQIVKYRDLYNRIEDTLPHITPDKLSEYVQAIRSEFNRISLDDPEFSASINEKYIVYCKQNEIESDDSIATIKKLMGQSETVPKQTTSLASPASPTSTAAPTSTAPIAVPIAIIDRSSTIIDTHTPIGTLSKQNYRKYMNEYNSSDQTEWALQRFKALGEPVNSATR
jgi:hypothetical protein